MYSGSVSQEAHNALNDAGWEIISELPKSQDVKNSWVVSHKECVLQKGFDFGCRTICIEQDACGIVPTLFAPTFEEAVRFILAEAETH